MDAFTGKSHLLKTLIENMKTIKLDNIPSALYEGYLWMSDESEPIVLHNEPLNIALDNNKNPFCIEGFLLDKTNRKSISIKFIDGEYLIYEYDISDIKDTADCILYLPNRMKDKGVQRLRFFQDWIAEPDLFSERMEVLKPAGLIFLGF